MGSQVGLGSTARIFLTPRDGRTGSELCALKVLSPGPVDPGYTAARFDVEARLWAELRHPNLVRVVDCGSEDGVRFLVRELVQGGSLQDLLLGLSRENEPLGAAVLCELGDRLCSALEHMHVLPTPLVPPAPRLHRHVEPSNVLVSTGGEVKLSDGVVARAREGVPGVGRAAVVERPLYAPPERLAGLMLDERADVYGLALTLYVAAVSHLPVGRSLKLPQRTFHRRLPPLQVHRPDLPAELVEAIERGCRAAPARRWGTVRQLHDALPPHDGRSAARALGSLVRAFCPRVVQPSSHREAPTEVKGRDRESVSTLLDEVCQVSDEDILGTASQTAPQPGEAIGATPTETMPPDFDADATARIVIGPPGAEETTPVLQGHA